jgi:hypothetical protein
VNHSIHLPIERTATNNQHQISTVTSGRRQSN